MRVRRSDARSLEQANSLTDMPTAGEARGADVLESKNLPKLCGRSILLYELYSTLQAK